MDCYRLLIYANGFIRQTKLGSFANSSWTFPVPFSNTNYSLCGLVTDITDSFGARPTKNTTSFSWGQWYHTMIISDFTVEGY